MRLSIIIIFLAGAIGAIAQGGSNYSILGIGDINYSGNAAYESLGGTTAAFPSEFSINQNNPALWSLVRKTRLQSGYRFNQHYNEAGDNSLWQNNGTISGLNALFAIDSAQGVAASLGMVPYSNVNYYLSNRFELFDGSDTLKGNEVYRGKGGISMVYFGVSTRVYGGLYVGAQAFGKFGSISKLQGTEFDDFNYRSSDVSKEDFISGFGMKYGMYYEPVDKLGIGAYYENHFTSKLEREIFFFNSLQNQILNETINEERELNLPSAWGIGLSYRTGVWQFGADIAMQDFTGFDYEAGNDAEFKNSMRFGIGAERLGNRRINAEILDKVSYKFGFTYRDLYYSVAGNDISETAFTFGAQIPWNTDIISDVSFMLGSRGGGDGTIQNYFGRFSVDISISETWFVPFKRDF
jgi:hypothetical protein